MVLLSALLGCVPQPTQPRHPTLPAQDNIQQALLAADHEVPSLMVALLTFLNELVQVGAL